MKQLKFFSNSPPDKDRDSSSLCSSTTVETQDISSLSIISIVNARHPKQKLYCHALIEIEDPSQIFLVIFDKKASVPSRSRILQEGSRVDYVQFILTQVYQQSSLKATYDRLNKLYVNELHTDITRELITQCILAKSARKRYFTIKKQFCEKPIQIMVSHDFYTSIALQYPIQHDSTVTSRTKTFLLPREHSSPKNSLSSEDKFCDYFSDIEVDINTDEYDALTLALAFNSLTSQQQLRLEELKHSKPELNDVLVEWASHLRIKYVDKGFTPAQVKHIHSGEYDKAGVFHEENELVELLDFDLHKDRSHHVSDM